MFLIAVDISYEGIHHYWFNTEKDAVDYAILQIKNGWWSFDDVSLYEIARSIDLEVI